MGKLKALLKYLVLAIIFSLLTACANTDLQTPDSVADPYQHFNRNTYRFNNELDEMVLRPTARGYVKITPYRLRMLLNNFFNNVEEVSNTANDILQGSLYWTLNDFWRFAINSTLGIGGLFDPATKLGLIPHNNSFGYTLAAWGAKPGAYLVLPLEGPATVTGANGLIGDFYMSPWGFVIPAFSPRVGIYAFQSVNTRANLLQSESLSMQLALDPYAFMRSAYLQYRTHQLWINKHPPVNGN